MCGKSTIITFSLAILEPKVFEHHVKTLRFIPRGVEHPKDGEVLRSDPGPSGNGGGAPWRQLNGVERSVVFQLYVGFRLAVNLNFVKLQKPMHMRFLFSICEQFHSLVSVDNCGLSGLHGYFWVYVCT